ncbi:unnamed protein product, partial [Ectocarpus sp. 12 AP-2014]
GEYQHYRGNRLLRGVRLPRLKQRHDRCSRVPAELRVCAICARTFGSRHPLFPAVDTLGQDAPVFWPLRCPSAKGSQRRNRGHLMKQRARARESEKEQT